MPFAAGAFSQGKSQEAWTIVQLDMVSNQRTLRRSFLYAFSAVGMTACTPALVRSQSESSQCRNHVAWVAACLKSMQTIRPGMTRDELLKVFTTEGGISTALHRTFVSRDCPYFKVDVTFHRAIDFAAKTDQKDSLSERGDDVIATIAQPYLQYNIMD